MRENYVVPICYPVAFQTFILIFERFLHWFPGGRSGDDKAATSDLKERHRNKSVHSMTGDTEDSEINGNEPTMPEDTQHQSIEATAERRSRPVLWVVTILVSICINLPILVSGLSIGKYSVSSVYVPVIDEYIEYYLIVCLLLMICVVSAGYSVASSFRILRSKSFTILEYLIVMSLIGNVGRIVFIFITYLNASLENASETESTTIGILAGVIIILECYYQLPFCFVAIRVVVFAADGNHQHRRVMLFKSILIYLAVCNAMLWVANILQLAYRSDWFDLAKPHETIAWRLTGIFLRPFILFYRFGCFLLIAKALGKSCSEAQISNNINAVDMPK